MLLLSLLLCCDYCCCYYYCITIVLCSNYFFVFYEQQTQNHLVDGEGKLDHRKLAFLLPPGDTSSRAAGDVVNLLRYATWMLAFIGMRTYLLF